LLIIVDIFCISFKTHSNNHTTSKYLSTWSNIFNHYLPTTTNLPSLFFQSEVANYSVLTSNHPLFYIRICFIMNDKRFKRMVSNLKCVLYHKNIAYQRYFCVSMAHIYLRFNNADSLLHYELKIIN